MKFVKTLCRLVGWSIYLIDTSNSKVQGTFCLVSRHQNGNASPLTHCQRICCVRLMRPFYLVAELAGIFQEMM